MLVLILTLTLSCSLGEYFLSELIDSQDDQHKTIAAEVFDNLYFL